MIESPDKKSINDQYLNDSKWTVEINGKDYPAVLSLKSLYAPKLERIKV